VCIGYGAKYAAYFRLSMQSTSVHKKSGDNDQLCDNDADLVVIAWFFTHFTAFTTFGAFSQNKIHTPT